MGRRETCVAVLALLVSPAYAAAGTVAGQVDQRGFGDFKFRGGAGEANRVEVKERSGGGVVFTDRAAPIDARGDCRQRGARRVECPRAQGKIVVRLREGDDRVRIRGFAPAADFVRFVEAYGGDGDDRLVGGEGPDYLFGRDGNDILNGLGDGDSVRGGQGDDLIKGGAGTDTLDGKRGADRIQGREDNDVIRGGRGGDILKGGGGGDDIKGGRGADELQGREGDDLLLRGGPGRDLVKGGDGDDILDGRGGADHLQGRAGEDVLAGDQGDDLLKGGGESDTLSGGPGTDTLRGRYGDDVLDSRTVTEDLSLPAEPDRVRGGDGTDNALPDANDRLSGTELVSTWMRNPLEPDHLLNLFTQPAIGADGAVFAASCEAPEGCRGTVVMTDATPGGDGEELGRGQFDLAPAGEGVAQEIAVGLTDEGARRLEEGTRVAVHVEPHPDSEVHPHEWGYRAFMRAD